MQPINIFWFRRDLRLEDNAGLYYALKANKPVLPIFIFDTNILDKLEDNADARVTFIYQTLAALQKQLLQFGSSLQIFYGKPLEVYKKIEAQYKIETVFTNHDYELYGIERDSAIQRFLASHSIQFKTYKDHVIFEKNEVLKDDGKPYTVFTPYSRKWKACLQPFHYKAYPTSKYFKHFFKQDEQPIISLQQMGFTASSLVFPSHELNEEIVRKYTTNRDFPAIESTSKLGLHLRFGTVSIRQLLAKALTLNDTFVNELIWRDFYHMILWHFPHVGLGKAFRQEYDAIEWRHDDGEFEKWCKGQTGYPIVDAGMRELNSTGFMHNRVRMIVASFLTKHLLLDWRLGEDYFAQKLLDFDFAANNGGWQWASGSGCDAAPYFRIFNPYLQTKKFDENFAYIKKWMPEFQEFSYPKPIVEHEVARKRCLEVYAKALKKS
ncbi:MAG: deoxyribodipyrimidine photo-lyase [Ferruginibacter sp.]|nr:deoxyribodipyrimidine photo-lyase [Ferruginibacter sp.]